MQRKTVTLTAGKDCGVREGVCVCGEREREREGEGEREQTEASSECNQNLRNCFNSDCQFNFTEVTKSMLPVAYIPPVGQSDKLSSNRQHLQARTVIKH